ncbi:MAG: TolC family protein [Deltaproteobacteria bacterium]|nr:TolC family protein [Deltaproteobacteria bacterium]
MKTRNDPKGKNRPAIVFVIFLFFFLAAMMAEAGSAAGERLTLDEAVRMALNNNHELQAQRNAHAAKGAEVGIARSSLLPKISLEERYLRTASPVYAFMTKLNQERIEFADFAPDTLNHPGAINDFQTAVTFEQPLFVKKANIGIEMSKMEVSASEEALHRKKEEVAFKVVQYYLMVSTTGAYVKVAEKSLEDVQEHQRLAEVRYAAGLGLYSDTLRAATAAAEARQRFVSAEKNFSVAKRALGLMVGSAEAVEVAAETPALPVREIESLRTQSQARRDVKSLEMKTENARNQIKLAEAGYYPMLGVGGTYQWNDHNHPLGGEGDGWQVMAFLRWELFDGAKTKYEKIKAGYQASEAEEYLKGMKKMVSFQVDEAWLTLEEAKKNQELAQEELKTAEEGRRLVKVRYEGALSPMVDLLDAQVSFDRARANRVAKENEYKLAIFNLGYASGTILQELQMEEQNGRTK